MNTETDSPASETADWHVLHVRPRCEKKMADYCVSLSVANYLPLRTEHKVHQRRKLTVTKPLFPGYVFAAFDPSRRVVLLKSQMIAHILKVPDQARLATELDQIRRALEVNPALSACPALTRGTHVRIVEGPLRGLEGVVASLKSLTQVILNVDIIGRGAAVTMEADMLETL